MELQGFIKDFAEQFDDTEEDEIQADTDFTELDEWSSLTAIRIIAFIDVQYEVSISAREIRQAKTVEELFNIVRSKKS